MKFNIPRKLKKKLKKFKWTKNGAEVKPWKDYKSFEEYKAGNLEYEFWKTAGRIL